MHFRHRQTDTDIVAKARDVYITSRTKNAYNMLSVLVHFSESKLFHNCSVAYCKICFFIGMHFDLKLQVINSVVQGFFVGSEIYP